MRKKGEQQRAGKYLKDKIALPLNLKRLQVIQICGQQYED